MANKEADLAGPGIGTYDEVENILPKDYWLIIHIITNFLIF